MKFNKTNKFIHLIGHTIKKITTRIMKLKTPYKHDTHNHVFPLTQQTCPITMNIKTISILNTSNKIKSNILIIIPSFKGAITIVLKID
jgi:hypothetical protein